MIGSAIAFIVATACCWLPVLIIAVGGGSTLVGISNGLEKFSGIFMATGFGLLGYGVYQYQNRKNQSLKKEVIFNSRIACPECGQEKEGDCCVYCSYETIACPPIQLNQKCC